MEKLVPSGSRRVAFFETVPWELHFLASLELAIDHAEKGWLVDYFFFEDAFQFPLSHPRRLFGHARIPSRIVEFFDLKPELRTLRRYAEYVAESCLAIRVHVVPPALWRASHARGDRESALLAELKGFNTGTLNADKYIRSSLIALTSDIAASPVRYPRLLRNLQSTFAGLARFGEVVMTENAFDRVVVFNGRFAENGPFVEIAQRLRMEVCFHERGGLVEGNYSFHSWRPHDLAKRGEQALFDWKNLDSRTKKIRSRAIQQQFERAEHSGGLAFSRVLSERAIRPDAAKTGNLVVFFTSTEGEFASVPGLSQDSCFENQFEALVALSNACAELGFDLRIRIHPNVSSSSRHEKQRWNRHLRSAIRASHVYASDNRVDSYELLSQASVVCVWQSTLGLESVWRGIPTITFAETPYESAGCDVRRVASPENLQGQILEALGSSPDPKSVFPFANHKFFGGERFTHLDLEEWSFETRRSKAGAAVRRIFGCLILVGKGRR
jgi:hypothetical protein